MFTNVLTVNIGTQGDEMITVGLRFPLTAQIKMKKKYNTNTRDLMLNAGSDDEVLIDVLTESLNWNGNDNSIHDGMELLETMINTGNMGIVARQRLVIDIGRTSGIFSEKEAEKFVSQISSMEEKMFADDDSDDDSDGVTGEYEKNV